MQISWSSADLLDWENFKGTIIDAFGDEWTCYIELDAININTDDEEEYFVAHAHGDRGVHWLSTGETPEEAMNSLIEEHIPCKQ